MDSVDKNLEKKFEATVADEKLVHGSKWQSMYGGYFADRGIAEPLVSMVSRAASDGVDVLVDLGGGTGFVLNLVLERNIVSESTRVINLDISTAQQAQVTNPRIETCCSSMLEFTRSDLASDGEKVLFITRSTLHYAGIFGLKPVVRHIRSQMKPGEHFVHQTICHDNPEESLLLDELMEMVKSDKWMPPLSTMLSICADNGLEVVDVCEAESLPMPLKTMANRYHVDETSMGKIMDRLKREYPASSLLSETEDEPVVLAPYRVFTCRAV